MGGIIASIEAFGSSMALHQRAWPPRDEEDSGPVKRSSLREMQQAWRFEKMDMHYKFDNGYECAISNAYGYGLIWLQDCEGKTFVGHSGGLPGFGSNWLIMPEYGIGVVLLVN